MDYNKLIQVALTGKDIDNLIAHSFFGDRCYNLSELLRFEKLGILKQLLQYKRFSVDCDIDPEQGLHIFESYFAHNVYFWKDYHGPLIYCGAAHLAANVKYANVAPISVEYAKYKGKNVDTSRVKVIVNSQNIDVDPSILMVVCFEYSEVASPALLVFTEKELFVNKQHPLYNPRLDAIIPNQVVRAQMFIILHELHGDVMPANKESWTNAGNDGPVILMCN